MGGFASAAAADVVGNGSEWLERLPWDRSAGSPMDLLDRGAAAAAVHALDSVEAAGMDAARK